METEYTRRPNRVSIDTRSNLGPLKSYVKTPKRTLLEIYTNETKGVFLFTDAMLNSSFGS